MLLKTWFVLVSVILVSSLAVLLYDFNIMNILHWISLIIIMITIILTILVYLENPHKSDLVKLQKTYADFLKEKDKRIDELQQKSDIILKTAMRRTDKELSELKTREDAEE